jgi:hypothetical protein
MTPAVAAGDRQCEERRPPTIFAIVDQLGCIEGAPNTRVTGTKPAAPFVWERWSPMGFIL